MVQVASSGSAPPTLTLRGTGLGLAIARQLVEQMGGKLSVELKSPLDTQRALSIAYTPGVAQVSRAIASDKTLAKKYRVEALIGEGGMGKVLLGWAAVRARNRCRRRSERRWRIASAASVASASTASST